MTSEVPRSPERFFGEYVPAELARLGASLGKLSSVGAVVFDVGAAGAWSLRLEGGAPSVRSGVDPDPLVRVTLAPDDFEPVIVAGAEKIGGDDAQGRELVAARVLTVDADRARMLREAPGSVALRLTLAAGAERRLTITLGGAEPKLDAPDCEVLCALEDFWALQGGQKNAFELLMDGKLKMSGRVELAMALAAALGG
ncbi:MAG TPA: SCP2 sterol-binding domain-containing protein [Polyangiaceae bacterium]|nr:SCP2 sterol-binding domain-containing protein [Polyangiaceae bacterium]